MHSRRVTVPDMGARADAERAKTRVETGENRILESMGERNMELNYGENPSGIPVVKNT